jgi:hypothetical protein
MDSGVPRMTGEAERDPSTTVGMTGGGRMTGGNREGMASYYVRRIRMRVFYRFNLCWICLVSTKG